MMISMAVLLSEVNGRLFTWFANFVPTLFSRQGRVGVKPHRGTAETSGFPTHGEIHPYMIFLVMPHFCNHCFSVDAFARTQFEDGSAKSARCKARNGRVFATPSGLPDSVLHRLSGGKATTSSMPAASVSSMTRRSRPRAIPAEGGMEASSRRKGSGLG